MLKGNILLHFLIWYPSKENTLIQDKSMKYLTTSDKEYLSKFIKGVTKINILWAFEKYMFKAKKHID